MVVSKFISYVTAFAGINSRLVFLDICGLFVSGWNQLVLRVAASLSIDRGFILAVQLDLGAARRNYLGHGLNHLCLVLKPAAFGNELAEEIIGLRALEDGRVLDSLPQHGL